MKKIKLIFVIILCFNCGNTSNSSSSENEEANSVELSNIRKNVLGYTLSMKPKEIDSTKNINVSFQDDFVFYEIEEDSSIIRFGQASWKLDDLDNPKLTINNQMIYQHRVIDIAPAGSQTYYYLSGFELEGVFDIKFKNGKIVSFSLNDSLTLAIKTEEFEREQKIFNSYNEKELEKELEKEAIAAEKAKCRKRDERFITNKMGQLNRDVIDIQETSNRVYLVTYVDWSTGRGRNVNEVFNYSNTPCN